MKVQSCQCYICEIRLPVRYPARRQETAGRNIKVQIVLKELRKSRFWIRLIKRASLIPKDKISPILCETDELIKIIAKSVVTSKIKK